MLLQQHAQHFDGRLQIRVIELVRDVPAERAELTPLLDHTVEEREAEQQLLPRLAVGARVKMVLVQDEFPRTLQVSTKSLRKQTAPRDERTATRQHSVLASVLLGARLLTWHHSAGLTWENGAQGTTSETDESLGAGQLAGRCTTTPHAPVWA